MKRLLSMAMLWALAGCSTTEGHGQRCNPLQFASDCNSGFTCVYPTAPNCGVSYCCAVDDNGNVIDTSPSCQPDPTSAAQCGVDLGSSD